MPTVVPYAPSQIYQPNGRLVDLLRLQGEQSAEAQRRAGEIQQQMWSGLGNAITSGVGNVIKAQQDAPINALNQQKVKDAQALSAGQQKVDSLLQPQTPQGPAEGGGNLPAQHPYLDANGLYDIQKLTSALASSGIAHLAPELLKGAESINASVEKHQQTQQALGQASTLLYGDMADGARKLIKAGVPPDQALDFASAPGMATQRFDPQQFAQMKAKLLSLPSDQLDATLGNLMDAASKVSGNKTLSKDAQELDRYGRVVASNVVPDKPNEAELALKAAQGDPSAIAAMGMLKPKPDHATTEADLDKDAQDILAKKSAGTPLSINEVSKLAGYVQRKRVVADATNASTNARLDKSEAFQEAQAGRSELTNKIEAPYQDALSKAALLKNVIDLAKNGNMVAGSLQPLVATMATIGAEGFKRLTGTELATTAGAGSAWERLKGSIGKLVEGQPIPAQVQKDMVTLADALAGSAYDKYKQGFDAVTQRYKLSDESALPKPALAQPAPISPSANPFR